MNKILDKIIRFFRFRILFKNLPDNFTALLDIGCGKNPWFFYLNDRKLKNVEITGIDLETPKFETKPPNVEFINAEIKNTLSFKDNEFDLITILAVLEHLDEPEKIIKEIYRILKPNGVLILTTPSKFAKPILEFLAFKLHLIDEDSIASHKNYFDKKILRNILLKTGFTIKKINYFELGANVFVKATKLF